MKILISAALILMMASCNDGNGDRTYKMETNETEAPTSDPNANRTMFDTSARNVQDTSTVIDYDTSSKR